MRTYSYSAILEPGEDPSVTVVTFPDVPEAITEGSTPAETAENAADALGTALLAYVRAGRVLPVQRSAGSMVVTVAPDVAAKLAVLETFATAAISKSELGRRMGKDEKEVRRILDPMHPTKIGALAAALGAMGRRLIVGFDEAA